MEVSPHGGPSLADPLPDLPYFVRRSRLHNVPVYKDITHGNRQMTVIRKVEGDIWVSGHGARRLGRARGSWPEVACSCRRCRRTWKSS